MTTNTATHKTRTITMTGRPPVKIREDQWPITAHGEYSDHDNQYDFQANRKWQCDIRVRQHADGRAIVYGVYDYDTAFQNERGVCAKAGELLDSADEIIAAIYSVGTALMSATEGHDFGGHISAAMRDAIADLPAEEL